MDQLHYNRAEISTYIQPIKLNDMNNKMNKLMVQMLLIKIGLILIVVGGIIIYTYNSI